jgi:hypothetical protein
MSSRGNRRGRRGRGGSSASSSNDRNSATPPSELSSRTPSVNARAPASASNQYQAHETFEFSGLAIVEFPDSDEEPTTFHNPVPTSLPRRGGPPPETAGKAGQDGKTTPNKSLPGSRTHRPFNTVNGVIKFNRIFDDKDADCLIESADHIFFKAHQWPLSRVSPVLKQKLSPSNPEETVIMGNVPLLQLEEDEETLETLLLFIYPDQKNPTVRNAKLLDNLLEAAKRYKCEKLEETIRTAMDWNAAASELAIEAFAIAKKWRFAEKDIEACIKSTMQDDFIITWNHRALPRMVFNLDTQRLLKDGTLKVEDFCELLISQRLFVHSLLMEAIRPAMNMACGKHHDCEDCKGRMSSFAFKIANLYYEPTEEVWNDIVEDEEQEVRDLYQRALHVGRIAMKESGPIEDDEDHLLELLRHRI